MEGLRSCRICDSKQFEPRYEKKGFKIDKCLHCGLVQVRNSPKNLPVESYYEQDFFDKYYGSLQSDSSRQRYEYKKFDYRWDEIEKKTAGRGRVLDIGCSFGFFLDAARRRGWECYGVEISAFAADYAKTRFGITVVNKRLEDADFDSGFFDLITLWNVIEHLEDPMGAVRHIHRILKTGGMIVLTTGNVESPLARLQGKNWRMLIPPIHLSHFSPSTIKHLMESCSLTITEQTSALPYESQLTKLRLIHLCKSLNLSDKMLVYTKKLA